MKVRLGIIGTGIAARELHLPALRNLAEKFEITAVCNHTEKKAKEFSSVVGGVPYFLDYRDLLAFKNLDAVDIVLPIELNYQVTLDALECGKHVIVEKPIASSLSDAELMSSFSSRFKSVMMVAENYRYNPVFEKAGEMLAGRMIGEPYSVFWEHFTVTDLDNKYAQTRWRINHQYPGGFVMDAGIHNIAVLRDLFGEVKSGVAFTRRVNPEIGRMDSMSFQFVFANGVNGQFNMYFSAQGLNWNRLLILGSEGSLIVEGKKITLKRQKSPDVEEIVETDGGYQGQFEDFYNCIVKGERPISTFEKAFKDLRTMVRALDSVRSWNKLEFDV